MLVKKRTHTRTHTDTQGIGLLASRWYLMSARWVFGNLTLNRLTDRLTSKHTGQHTDIDVWHLRTVPTALNPPRSLFFFCQFDQNSNWKCRTSASALWTFIIFSILFAHRLSESRFIMRLVCFDQRFAISLNQTHICAEHSRDGRRCQASLVQPQIKSKCLS